MVATIARPASTPKITIVFNMGLSVNFSQQVLHSLHRGREKVVTRLDDLANIAHLDGFQAIRRSSLALRTASVRFPTSSFS